MNEIERHEIVSVAGYHTDPNQDRYQCYHLKASIRSDDKDVFYVDSGCIIKLYDTSTH